MYVLGSESLIASTKEVGGIIMDTRLFVKPSKIHQCSQRDLINVPGTGAGVRVPELRYLYELTSNCGYLYLYLYYWMSVVVVVVVVPMPLVAENPGMDLFSLILYLYLYACTR